MLCERPFKRGVLEFSCGGCIPCKVNRKRLWTGRFLLEMRLHTGSVFATLTYEEDPHSVSPRDLVLFIRRLRDRIPGVRYYGVGEYGDRNGRPHYHLALFGVGLHQKEEVNEAWGLGHTLVGPLNEGSAAYTVGYIFKGATKPSDPRLKGRYPEFARMSLRPGIGAGAIPAGFGEWLTSEQGARYIAENIDVPGSLKIDGKTYGLGRYLKQQMRAAAGMEKRIHPNAERAIAEKMKLELFLEEARKKRENKRLTTARDAKARRDIANSLRRI